MVVTEMYNIYGEYQTGISVMITLN